jgi:periplasmic divalent cation tolerance protein
MRRTGGQTNAKSCKRKARVQPFLRVFSSKFEFIIASMQLLVVLCTFPDEETAKRIGHTLVESRLAACVNLLPRAQSIYRWQDKIESAEEVLAMMKTTADVYPKLEARLTELHPYEVPEIIALPVEKAAAAYAKWVAEMTCSPKGGGRIGDTMRQAVQD